MSKTPWDRLGARLQHAGALGKRVDATLWDDVGRTLVELGRLRNAAQAAEAYVAATLAIRTASYPSTEFTSACSAATDAYHALLASFGVPPPPRA
jgi:hypothetical protein